MVPLALHVLVLPDPHDGPEGERLAETLAGALIHDGRYDVVGRERIAGKIGDDPSVWIADCGADVACWAENAAPLGLDLIAVVERVGDAEIGLRLVDVRGPRIFAEISPDTGWPGEDLMARRFFASASLRVAGAPEGADWSIDAGPWMPIPEVPRRVDAGRHLVELRAPGLAGGWRDTVSLPGDVTTIDGDLPEKTRTPSRARGWIAAGAVGLAGGLAVGVATLADPRAVPAAGTRGPP